MEISLIYKANVQQAVIVQNAIHTEEKLCENYEMWEDKNTDRAHK